MEKKDIPYVKKIFVCTNDAKGEKSSCGDQSGEEIFKQLRGIAKERNLHPKIRVAQAKCLGQCSRGCNVMIYPDNIWYSGVTTEQVQELADQWIVE